MSRQASHQPGRGRPRPRESSLEVQPTATSRRCHTSPPFLNPSQPVATVEFLILSDGTVLAHNLTPAMADVLRALNPDDLVMSHRARRHRS